jgi:hypothetical protein
MSEKRTSKREGIKEFHFQQISMDNTTNILKLTIMRSRTEVWNAIEGAGGKRYPISCRIQRELNVQRHEVGGQNDNAASIVVNSTAEHRPNHYEKPREINMGNSQTMRTTMGLGS